MQQKFKHEKIDEESDGVVTASSQISYPGAVIGRKMENTNHMQQRNHPETKARLNELFNGDYGDEFRLDKN